MTAIIDFMGTQGILKTLSPSVLEIFAKKLIFGYRDWRFLLSSLMNVMTFQYRVKNYRNHRVYGYARHFEDPISIRSRDISEKLIFRYRDWRFLLLRVINISASEGRRDLILGLNEAEYACLFVLV